MGLQTPNWDRDPRPPVPAERAELPSDGPSDPRCRIDVSPPHLTREQELFGACNAASPGLEASHGMGVYFYRHFADATIRWLVDPAGDVRERSVFPHD
jgi:hypothetical protein